ncbi:GGDEF domain-containing protein [uncultured Jatrophihabitans sp.]|uniref:GGDEF domain-containing protein n=1 Tax=uncultured Jatrophihabitans sp. TaxID=1610747 RepID=UPI0035C9F080
MATAEVAAAALVVLALAGLSITGSTALRATVIVGLSIAYTELSRRPATLRRFLHADGPTWSDQTSVWTAAAVLVLPWGWACLAVLAVYGHRWYYTRLDRTEPLFRYAFSLAATIMAAGAAHLVGQLIPESAPGWLAQAGLVVQLLVYTTTALAVGLTAMRLRTPSGTPRPWRAVVPPASSVGLELGALTIGLMLALLATHALVLTPLVLGLTAFLQRACLTEELATAARTDPKTGLLNSRGWAAVTSAAAHGTGAVLIVDIDRFKKVNDTHGHLVGDQVILEVTARLRRQLREQDELARWGGEEFAVWLPDADAATAQIIAERLRAAIADEPIDTDAGPVRVTVSVGAASSTGHDAIALDTLLASADAGVYRAKNAGRNKVDVAAHV